MMKKGTILVFLAILGISITGYGQGQKQGEVLDELPVAPEKYRRPEGYDPVTNRYKYSLKDLREQFSEKLMQDAGKEYARIAEVNCGGKWKPTGTSLDQHVAPEWFNDVKFGMFIDWGLWAVGGWAVKRNEGAMYPDWYEHRIDHNANAEKYHDKNWGEDFQRDDLIPFFKAENYQPGNLIDIAVAAGMKYVIPFCKHHSGFCLWPSSYTHRDAGDRVGKDLIQPIVDNCKAKGLKFGFYFSTEEWEYPVIDTKGELIIREWAGKYKPYDAKYETLASGKIAVKDFAKDYIIPQAVEFIDKYDPDILWYDGEWDSPTEILGCYDIAAYFYNKAEGKKEVAVNDRYGLINGKWSRSYRGDIFTSEYGDMTDDNRLRHTWEENRGISQSFGFNWQDTDENVITSKEFIDMFVDIVAKGGNLLLIVNLDSQGALPEVQEKRLRDIGKWLATNGEGIYNTRAYSVIAEDNVRYTRSKDNKTVYAISLAWPGKQLQLKSVEPAKNSKIYMLGYNEPLKWSWKNGVTIITLPSKLQNATNRPCDYAYIFKILQQ
ncbi:MAG: alpha-L-fucosidase [Prevotellaceae bacterium]|jgi:alpha-L-fucosidase|nr:alpha-L-fucosidase [Prevotellaceae bacterium]